MGNVIVLDDNVFTKLEKNAEMEGVTPEVWVSMMIDQEFNFASRPRASSKDRANINAYQKILDARLRDAMKLKYRKALGLDPK